MSHYREERHGTEKIIIPVYDQDNNNNNNNNNNNDASINQNNALLVSTLSVEHEQVGFNNTTTTTTTIGPQFVVDNDDEEDTATRHTTTNWIGCCTRRSPSALAWSRTTPFIIKLLLPFAILCNHYGFYYGQTANMWKLTQNIQYNMSYTVTSRESKIVFDSFQLPLHNNYTMSDITDRRTFTYMYAIHELWYAKHLNDVGPLALGKLLPKVSALLLIIFSGIWPHLKLITLMITWFVSKNPIRRSRILSALSVLGKWSLADVLVVCVMVGVLNVSWTFTSTELLHNVQQNLPTLINLVHSTYSATDLCSNALHFSCNNPKIISHILQCKACRSTVNELFDHPESAEFLLDGIETEGGGTAELYVAGLRGIYAFCIAVISSILLSLIVDYLDHLEREEQRKQRMLLLQNNNNNNNHEQLLLRDRTNTEEDGRTISPEITGTLAFQQRQHHSRDNSVDHGYLMEPLLPLGHNSNISTTTTLSLPRNEIRSRADIDFDRQALDRQDRCQIRMLQTIAYTTAIFVISAVYSTTMERKVHGAVPELLHQLCGLDMNKVYSFIQLAGQTALAGGWDVLLLSTFCLFVIVGPIIRAILCIYAMKQKNVDSGLTCPEQIRLYKKRMSRIIDFFGAFCAWEVFAGSVVMVDLLMPTITSTILSDGRCQQFLHNPICFEVEFDVHKQTFVSFVIGGGILLVLISQHIRSKQY